MKIIGIIPARYQSSRFPGKPLTEIRGKSMIRRVYEQASKCRDIAGVIVATDDQRIFDHVHGFGGRVVMTSVKHQSGTERCAEALSHAPEADAVINIQGDEPFINPLQITQVAELLKDGCDIATLIKKIDNKNVLTNPNTPKVVVDVNGKALYFSRAAIPYVRDEKENEGTVFYKHIGIYGYQSEVLKKIVTLSPTPLEQAEKLEQLRWLEHGFAIQTTVTEIDTQGIDTPEDWKRFN